MKNLIKEESFGYYTFTGIENDDKTMFMDIWIISTDEDSSRWLKVRYENAASFKCCMNDDNPDKNYYPHLTGFIRYITYTISGQDKIF